MRVWLVTSATSILASISRQLSNSSNCTLCKGDSAWSTKINLYGFNPAICLTISRPIEPAAPVIIILFPSIWEDIFRISTWIGSLCNKSSIWISFICIPSFPRSLNGGTVRIRISSAINRSIIPEVSSRCTFSEETIIASILSSSKISNRDSLFAYTLHPIVCFPIKPVSSEINPFNLKWLLLLTRNDLAILIPDPFEP